MHQLRRDIDELREKARELLKKADQLERRLDFLALRDVPAGASGPEFASGIQDRPLGNVIRLPIKPK